uniref:Tag-140 protein n=1 Tax=Pristionchus pacificus TaxID=54126 RepID=A0A8R1UE59_PRIPA
MSETTYDQIVNDTMQAAIRAAFVAAGPSNYTTEIDTIEQPNGWQTWVVGLGFITLCSFSAPLGIMILPCLAKWLYERLMSFLIALGIGTLSGSCFFIMIPQAFGLTRISGGLDYSQKSWIIVGALYLFFSIDRLLQYIFEFRRRRVQRKVHASSLKKAMEPPRRQETVTTGSVETIVTDEEGQIVRQRSVDSSEDNDQRNEIEITVLNNIIARTFSTRKRVAVVKVNDIEYENDLRSAPVTPRGSRKINRETLRRVNSDLDHIGDVSTAYSNMPGTAIDRHPDHHHNGHCNTLAVPDGKKKEDDEVSISVQVVEKRVVDPKDLEIASIAYIIIIGSSMNNFLDGMSMGAAFADSLLRGVSIGISSFSQQFPQEVGTLAILANSGLGVKRTLLINLVPAFLSYLGFTIGVLLDNVDESYDTYVFSVSAGMYLYVFLGTLIPEVRDTTEELIKTNMRESFLVTLLQFLGMGGGVTFMYFMNKLNDVEIS